MTQEADILARLRDEDLSIQISQKCNDPWHEDRYCPTCEARLNGIDDYRRAVLGPGPENRRGADHQMVLSCEPTKRLHVKARVTVRHG